MISPFIKEELNIMSVCSYASSAGLYTARLRSYTSSSEGKNTAEEVTAASVKKAGIIFTPGAKLQSMLKAAKFTKE
jgi:exosome complex RNA-binding protein Rrp42 (RNase PH superfamily)